MGIIANMTAPGRGMTRPSMSGETSVCTVRQRDDNAAVTNYLETGPQLFNLAGAKIPGVLSPVPVSAFALRASFVVAQFIAAMVIAPPVLSVVLVAFSGGLTEHARQVVKTAAVVQAVTFVLGVISRAGTAASHTRPASWFLLAAPGVALVLTALIFTGAVLWSRELRSLAPRFLGLRGRRRGL